MAIIIRFLVIILLVGQQSALNAAAPPLKEWQRTYGGNQLDVPAKVLRSSDGHILLLSNVDSQNGNIALNHGSTDIWLTRLDSLGNMVWQKSIGGSSVDVGTGIIELSNGNIIIAGYTSSSDFDIPSNHGNFDVFLMCLDSIGNIIWTKIYGGSNVDLCYALIPAQNNGFILGGSSFSDDGTLTSNSGDQDFWVIKTAANGNIIWQKSKGGNDMDVCYALQEDASGNIYACGTTNSTSGNLTSVQGGFDFCILKLNSQGSFLWNRCFGGSDYESAQTALIDSHNKILVGGYSLSSNGDVNSNYGLGDSWVIEINASGNLLSERNFGGSGGDNLYSILETSDGGYLLTSGSTSNDHDITNQVGSEDIWLFKTDVNFNTEWSHNYGGTGNDRPMSIIQNPDWGFLMAGYSFSNDVDVQGNQGSGDIWLLNLSCKQPSTTVSTNLNICMDDTLSFSNVSQNASQENWFLNTLPIAFTNPSQVIFNTPGIFNYALNVQTCYYSATQNVDITVSNCTMPVSNFASDTKVICENNQVSFFDSSARATSWQWDFPGGTPSTSTQLNPVVTYTQSGVYSVTLTTANSYGSHSTTRLNYITVNQSPVKPVVNVSGNSFSIPPVVNATYQWYLNGVAIPSANTRILNVLNDGYYTISVINQNGCSATSDSVYYSTSAIQAVYDTDNIKVYPNPTRGEISIHLYNHERGSLKLMNADGDNISEESLDGFSNEKTFKMENCKAGLYMVVYTNEKGKSKLNSIIKL